MDLPNAHTIRFYGQIRCCWRVERRDCSTLYSTQVLQKHLGR
ncbi:hypothetical protein PVAP13_8KG056884 [Panicum virgatum]|uniref:Uncharacterized protein n=1 Tax=Panicum virgatum TaxID=38727 RepID=A0A8T0PIA9_PANVG|nr:hypothetical protein PVAP13_8KG056884 [Panicum virgatum]